MFNLIQVEHGQKVVVDYARDALLTRFGHATLEDRIFYRVKRHRTCSRVSLDLCRRTGTCSTSL